MATPPAAPARQRQSIDLLGTLIASGALVFAMSFPVLTTGSASAAGPTLLAVPAAAPAGGKVSVSGAYFPSRTKVQLEWDGSASGMPAATVNAQGSFSVRFKVPARAVPGGHSVAAMAVQSRGGKGSPSLVLEASLTFTVTEAAPTPAATATPSATPAATATPTPTATPGPTSGPTAAPTAHPGPTPTPTPASTAGPSTAPSPTATPSPVSPKLLFGLGSQIETARSAKITQQSPIRLLTSWYNGPGDLGWITDSWHRSIYQGAYAAGYALHLVTWTDVPETTFSTSTGTVCGRVYPLSDRWRDDMRQLAQAFAGPASGPPLYVTLFTEFQTYPCIDNAWSPNAATTNYYRALIAQFRAGVAIFHQYAPNARVSLGWGGWQTRWDDPSLGGGRSMIPYFGTAMGAGDFVSFQAMAGDSNVTDIRSMTAALGAYGPVMIAHHMPDGDANSASTVDSTFYDDVRTLLTTSSVSDLAGHGLFAWSFMNDQPMRDSTAIFSFVASAVTTFGR